MAERNPADTRTGMIVQIALILGVAALMGSCWKTMGREEPMSEADRDTLNARIACRDAIESSLRDPDAANWGNRITWPTYEDDGVWAVEPTVTATNGFGARLKTTFICTLEKQGQTMIVTSVNEL